VVADLKDDFDAARQADIDLRENWDTVKEWTEASRYARKKKAAAQDLYDAITDRKHGVFPWLKPYW
jgi:antirestriction protein ArdC